MPLNMNRNVFITCAVTGSGDTTGKSDKVPVTPEQLQIRRLMRQRQGQQLYIAMHAILKQAPRRATWNCSRSDGRIRIPGLM